MGRTVTIDIQFVHFVADMRRQQRAFFDPKNAHRKESLLKSCKTIERQVDAYTKQILDAYQSLQASRRQAGIASSLPHEGQGETVRHQYAIDT
jgi:hypothetical protein